MPGFLEHIFAQLRRAADRDVLREIYAHGVVSVRGRELLEQVRCVRAYLRRAGVRAGERCAMLGPNSIRWVAFDLALMAEGTVVVPLYSRQAPAELAAMVRDSSPRLLFCSDPQLGQAVADSWPGAPPRVQFEDVLRAAPGEVAAAIPEEPLPLPDATLATIIY